MEDLILGFWVMSVHRACFEHWWVYMLGVRLGMLGVRLGRPSTKPMGGLGFQALGVVYQSRVQVQGLLFRL